jgi:diguanylate cyclase
LPLTISIGLTQAAAGEVAGPLLARADKALYNAKDAGRNCCRIILPETDTPTNQERLTLHPTHSDLQPR